MLNARNLVASLAGAATLLVGSPAVCADASAAPAAPSAHNLVLARRLFTDMHIEQVMSDVMKNVAPALVAQEMKSNPALSQAQAEAVTKAIADSNQMMMGKIMDRMIPLYASTFSEKELQDLVTFYEGPTGRAMLEKMPTLMAKISPIVVELMPEMQADLRKRLCSTTDCRTASPAAPKT